MGHIKMSKKEVYRVEVIKRSVRRELSQKEAGNLLGLSTRQIKRLVKRVRKEGIGGLCHRSRDRESRRKLSKEKELKIVALYKEKYPDFGPTFAQEKLKEEGVNISRESLRKVLIKNHLWEVQKKKKKEIHVWRARRSSEGELVQIDGSHHRWLEERLDQEFCLMAYIDDATNKVYGKFYEYEGVYPILDSMMAYTKKYGRPMAVYIDRHSTYKTTRKETIEEALEGSHSLTQFEQIMREIDINVIHARSPQAKGRVERLFKTLQDRLIKEMRLANICTIEAANEFLVSYLEKHDNRFSIAPKEACSVWRPLPINFDPAWTFSQRYTRTILNDFTIRWKNQIFLIEAPYLALKGQKVEIRQMLNGDLSFATKHKKLKVKAVENAPKKTKPMSMAEAKKKLNAFLGSETKSKKSWMDNFHFGHHQNRNHKSKAEKQLTHTY